MPKKRNNKKNRDPVREFWEKEGEKNVHHIICRSRGGGNDPSNTVLVNARLHKNFHKLFGNALPHEILDILVFYFWKGDISIIEDYLEIKKIRKEWHLYSDRIYPYQ